MRWVFLDIGIHREIEKPIVSLRGLTVAEYDIDMIRELSGNKRIKTMEQGELQHVNVLYNMLVT